MLNLFRGTARVDLISKFLREGILTKEKVGYCAGVDSDEELPKHMECFDLPSPSVSRGQMDILRSEKTYCPTGSFNPEQMLEAIRSFHLDSMENGFSACRWSAEMTWALREIPGSERVLEYESLVNNVLVDHPVTAICQYNVNRFDGKTILGVLKVHPKVIVHGQIVENPYYLSSQEFLKDHSTKNY